MNQHITTPEDPPREPSSPKATRLHDLYGLDRLLWRGKVGPAFWNIASLISISVNIILFIIILLLGRELFTLKNLVKDQLIDGLYTNFVKMDQAHIVTTIQVSDTIMVKDSIPVVFDLPLNQETTVVLTKNTPVKNATIFLNNQPVPLDIILRKGTPLNIALNLTVPVNQTVPVELTVPVDLVVPVDIALDNTDLHTPFVGLQDVVLPYKILLEDLPNSGDEIQVCDHNSLTNWFCQAYFGVE